MLVANTDLTEDHPTLTTYFEGEILGQKHTFTTPHASWGATPKEDIDHWSKFTAFRPYARAARRGAPVFIRDPAHKEHVFMRWKEQFLVPDHRVTAIRGASFEGFYYICFNQVKGEISGIYFHAKSEKYVSFSLPPTPRVFEPCFVVGLFLGIWWGKFDADFFALFWGVGFSNWS